jgi:ELWxxDGT repeat protein
MSRVVRAAALFVPVLLGAVLPAVAGTAELLADVSQGSSSSSTPAGVRGLFAPLGDRILFDALEPSSGVELWVSDGTPLGTRLLRDLAPGGESTDFRWLGTVRQTAVFFRDLDFGLGPFDLWRSDGTAAGTFPIGGSTPLEDCSWRRNTPEGASTGNRLYFLAGAPSFQCDLWKTDGTAAGTRVVAHVEEPASSLVAAGSRVFFFTESGGLWASNGESAGLLRGFGVVQSDGPRRLTAAGSEVVFLARESASEGEELWISDGTAAGTRALTQFFEANPFGFTPLLKVIGDTLYFTADDGTGTDLWQSAAGAAPRRVTDFIHRSPFGDALRADQIVRLGSQVILLAQEEGQWQAGLWVSGGAPGSTAPIAGCPGGCPQTFGTSLVQAGDRIMFEGVSPRDRREPWVTDGTGAGTLRLIDITLSFRPVALLGRAFFVGSDSNAGFSLWKTDGTAAGTTRLADLGSYPFGSSFSSFFPVAMGGRFFFRASPNGREAQLWVSDGSPGGTRIVSNILDLTGSSPAAFTPFAGGALFGAREESENSLWRTDGTAAGTARVRAGIRPLSIAPAPGGLALVLSAPDLFGPYQVWRTDGTEGGTFRIDPSLGKALGVLAPFGAGAVFGVEKENHRLSLWASDGTLAGTHALFDLPADVVGIRSLRVFGSRLYFVANQQPAIYDDRLWVSDGTAAGTRSVTGDELLDLLWEPSMAQVGGTFYLASRDGLWKTDGTAVGTAEVLSSPRVENRPTNLLEFHGALYFMVGGPGSPAERGLWRTDGTPAGTLLVKSLSVPAAGFVYIDPVRMVKAGDRLFFLAGDGEHGVELWTSDGTTAGTVLVRDITPGEGSSFLDLSSLTVAGGKVYFSATDGVSGFELWESDGTAAGTRRVQDIAPGALSSSPDELAVAGNRLFFAADDGVHGVEPWALPLNGGGCVPSATALCLGGRFRVEADWRDFQGNRGRGHAAALTADTGTFWFFDAANVEVILKVLDGRGVNGHQWVFYGALSNVEYTLTVTDTQSGAVRRYFNPRGWLGSLADIEAFGPRGASVAGMVSDGPIAQLAKPQTAVRSAAAAGCVPGAERLCLQGGRFAVEARWKRANGTAGTAKAVPLAGGDTGYLWFFDAANVEVVVKVLDGRPLNGKFWIFFGALSDVEYTLTVTDTQTGVLKTYKNPSGRLASVADTGAF